MTLNGFPYRPSTRRWSSATSTGRTGPSRERREYTLGLARLLAALLPDDVEEGSISTLPLGWREGWDDAAAGGRAARARATSPTGSRRCEARDRQADPARARARARLHDRDDRAGVRRRSPGSRPSGSASASTPAISRCSSRRADGALARLARRGRAGRQDAGVERAARADDPASAAGRELLGALRRAALPAPGARARERRTSPASTTCPRRWRGAPARRSASGACTSTCRCTRPSTRRRHELAATLAALAGGAAPLTRHLEVETYTWSVLRRRAARTTTGSSTGLAARAGLDARPARRARSGGGRMTLVVIDAVGLTPARAASTCRGCRARRRRLPGARSTRSCPPSPARCSRRFLTGPDAGRARHRRQRLVLPRPRRGVPLAPAQPARAGREGLGDRAPRASPASAPRTSAGGTRWARRPTSRSRRGRSTTPTARKSPDCYTDPPQLHDHLTGAARRVPAVPVLGADGEHHVVALDRRRGARSCSTTSSSTCCSSTCRTSTTTTSASAPSAPEAAAAARELDERRRRPGRPRARARRHGRRALASTGSPTRGGRSTINRALRRAGLLDVYTQAGMEYLDPWTSRAFAVADHQIAHVYVARPGRRRRARARRSPACAASPRCSTGDDAGATPGSTTSAPASSSRVAEPRRLVHLLLLARRRARARLRAARSRSTASPATTRPSCSSTRTTGSVQGPRRARRWRARRSGMRYVLSVVAARPVGTCAGTHGRLPDDERRRAGVPVLGRRRSRATGSPPPTCATCCSSSAGSARRWRPRPAPAPRARRRLLGGGEALLRQRDQPGHRRGGPRERQLGGDEPRLQAGQRQPVREPWLGVVPALARGARAVAAAARRGRSAHGRRAGPRASRRPATGLGRSGGRPTT